MRTLATLVATMAALAMSCGARSSEDPVRDGGSQQSPDGTACSARQSSGVLETDCQKYCSAYVDCAGCSESIRQSCESRCVGHPSELECLGCAVNHVHEVGRALRCDDQGSVFTLTFPNNDCGVVCGTL